MTELLEPRRRRFLPAVVGAVVGGLVVGIVFVVIVVSKLSAVEHQFAVSQKASTKTRVVTVTQRCVLTHLDAESETINAAIIGQFAPTQVAPFLALKTKYLTSYAGCERQLAKVKRINAATPAP